jgi:hypothetical protein
MFNDGWPDHYGPVWFAWQQDAARETQKMRRIQRRWQPSENDDYAKDQSEGDLWA